MMVADDEQKYEPPDGLDIPDNLYLPPTLKMHNLIEKTAAFISKHGLQMEILIKAKQASNSQFDFLSFDSSLNPYYKFLVSKIKSGDYIPKNEQEGSSGDSDDEDHYLHPSLLGQSRAPKSPLHSNINLPQLPRSSDENNSYLLLVKSIRDKIGSPGSENDNENNNNSSNNDEQSCGIQKEITSNSHGDSNGQIRSNVSILPSPSPEVEKIIDKLAQYVAKNGEDFEKSIRKRNESRFEFINPGNIYHGHYIRRKLFFLDEKRKQRLDEIKAKSNSGPKEDVNSLVSNCRSYEDEKDQENESSKNPISFCLMKERKKSFVPTQPDSEEENEKKQKSEGMQFDKIDSENGKVEQQDEMDLVDDLLAEITCDFQEKASREKQEERKKKAALFLTYLKQKQTESKPPDASSTHTSHSVVDGSLRAHHSLSPKLSNKITDSVPENSSRAASLLPFMSIDKPRDSSPSSPSESSQKRSHSHKHRHRHHHHRSSRSSRSSHRKSRSHRSRSPPSDFSPDKLHSGSSSSSKSRSRSRSPKRRKAKSKAR
ncbi:suppressor of white-apricot [Brevipalpus obovatus]|uniref:suppressor of white-apricot n=1 Tax=Brevipalpus obovatus TaxID=246614 RepID=UPI003D9E3AB7